MQIESPNKALVWATMPRCSLRPTAQLLVLDEGGMMMFRHSIMFFLLLTLQSIYSSAEAQTPWKTYRNSELRFRFLYPSDWTFGTPRGPNVKASLFPPDSGPRANCNIVVLANPDTVTDSQSTLNAEISSSILSEADWKAMMGQKWPDFRLIESKHVKVDNQPAFYAIEEHSHETVDRKSFMKGVILVTFTSGYSWFFSCAGKGVSQSEARASYKYWDSTFQRIFGSLVFESQFDLPQSGPMPDRGEEWEGKKILVNERKKVISACEQGVSSKGYAYASVKIYCTCSVDHMTEVATKYTKEQIKSIAEKKGNNFIEKEAFEKCSHYLE